MMERAIGVCCNIARRIIWRLLNIFAMLYGKYLKIGVESSDAFGLFFYQSEMKTIENFDVVF